MDHMEFIYVKSSHSFLLGRRPETHTIGSWMVAVAANWTLQGRCNGAGKRSKTCSEISHIGSYSSVTLSAVQPCEKPKPSPSLPLLWQQLHEESFHFYFWLST